jgi:hypothetical protein
MPKLDPRAKGSEKEAVIEDVEIFKLDLSFKVSLIHQKGRQKLATIQLMPSA